ncbi:uncharacterized protein LOC120352592 [Nilaparvata lugens]|uniref:uncharacterized protein LOC120352592 n=1 Tax=Nilaparvata lugens TaxID=108931 RepID=UPI00193EC0E7|nr:uncharacterized protein LOC120352592 [Nilaparvata lugens]
MDEIWITKNENDGESEYGSHSEASSDLTEEQIAAAKELEDILNEQENSQNTSLIEASENSTFNNISACDDLEVSNAISPFDDSDNDKDYVPDSDQCSGEDENIVIKRRRLLSSPFKNDATNNPGPSITHVGLSLDNTMNRSESESDNSDVFMVSSGPSGRKNERRTVERNIIKRNRNGVHSRKNKQERKEKRNLGKEYTTS